MRRLTWGLLFGFLMFGACVDDADPPADGGTDAAGEAALPDATPDDCEGCVDSTGACQPGTAEAACGGGGNVCTMCQAPTQCIEGSCEAPPACSPDNCPTGCCDDSGTCVGGAETTACGSGGLQCQTCMPNDTCTDGACQPPCGPDTCSGCCTTAGECVAGSDAMNCGGGGLACGRCGGGEVCRTGRSGALGCLAPCDCATGCCGDDGSCATGMGTSDTSCGGATATCIDCTGFGAICDAAQMMCSFEPGPDERFKIQILNARVPERDGDSTWDAFGGLPDPRILVGIGTESCPRESTCTYSIAQDATMSASNATFAVYDEVLFDETGVRFEDLQSGIAIRFQDSDTFGFQPMANCVLNPATSVYRSDRGPEDFSCPGGFEVRYDIVR